MRSLAVEHANHPAALYMTSIAPLGPGAFARAAEPPPPDELESCLGIAPLTTPTTPARSAGRARVGASRLDYIRGSTSSPVCLSIAAFAGCIGMGYAGILGAVVAVACVIALGIHAASYRTVRAYVDDQERTRAHQLRDCDRLRRLRPAGAARQQHFHELRLLVEEVERLDPTAAERFELQDLLTHFVELALQHQRCVDALRLASALPSCMPVIDTTRSALRRDILQRRIQHRDQCLRKMALLTDELEGIDEMIRLVVQRAATSQAGIELDLQLDRRLWELDEVDAAMRQLA